MRLSDEIELVLQNNPKRQNVNVKVIKLTSEQISGIFGLYSEGAYSIELGFFVFKRTVFKLNVWFYELIRMENSQ